tara:strand:+ start:72 stop:320 length:249 start_codon:yes stop_codon:yes gene_type:complete
VLVANFRASNPVRLVAFGWRGYFTMQHIYKLFTFASWATMIALMGSVIFVFGIILFAVIYTASVISKTNFRLVANYFVNFVL